MGFRWFNTSAARAILLMSGTAILTWGIAHMQFVLIAIGTAVLVYTMFTYKRGVKSLKEKCFLMLEAIRNNDYSFRLPTVYHSDNEQVLQDTINQFGNLMNEQKQQMVQREKFYEHIMASVSSGIIVLSDNDFVQQANPAAAKLLGLPVVSTLHQLERYDTEAVNLLRNLQPGERSQLHFLTEKGEANLSVACVRTQLNNKSVRILVLNDIRNELDEKELDSWIKLTRVLTHEIMNSIAPISSISDTFMHRQDVQDGPLYEGIRAIHETSSGLIGFVDSYRKFSALQKPQPEAFYIHEILQQIKGLDMIPPHIDFNVKVEPQELMLFADPNLVRQMLINLLKNAVQAIGDATGKIRIHAYTAANEHVYISISNNGPAIPNDVAEQIFVPFFSTKKEGSGIGLSLSRQIMKLSGGTITLLKSGTNGWPVTFLLDFA
ncbi:MAG: PAS domain-containing protein [Bacteroidaceae bacterium]|nr:PAS domain-containing protein [Bacteroidaceae bacterium]